MNCELITKILKTSHKCKDGKERPDVRRYIKLPNGTLILVSCVYTDAIAKFDACAEIVNERNQ